MAGAHVICAGPDPGWRTRVAGWVRGAFEEFEVATASNPETALAELDAVSTRVLVAAPRFPDADRSGTELLGTARDRAPDVACILYGDLADVSLESTAGVVAAVDAGADDAADQLVSLVERAVRGESHAAFPVPDGEPDRVATLADYPVDDDHLRTAFGRLADLAAATFDADYAYVSVMHAADQEHVACHGFEPRSLRRERSICAYTVAADEVTVVEDVAGDPRFGDVDYVEDLGLGWYVGAPIRASGATIGTLCVLGTGEYDGVDVDLLAGVAAEAADQFEFARLRRRE